MMTAMIALIRKDLKLYVNDKRALMLNLLMPILLASFFGFLFGGSGEAKTSKIDIGLVQEDTSALGKKIGDGLRADSNLRVAELSREEAQQRVRSGKLGVAVVIPAGFGEAAGGALFSASDKPELPLFYDPSQTTVLAMVKGLLTQQVMQNVSAEMFNGQAGRDFTDKSLKQLEANPDSAKRPELTELLGSLKKFQSSEDQRAAAASGDASARSQAGLSMPFTTKDEALSSGPKYNGYAHSFAGMGVQFILFMGVDMGIGILLARRLGIWNRLLAAPVTMNQVLLSRALSGAIIAFGLLLVIFLAGVVVFKVQISNPAGFVLVGISFALMTASFGLLIAAFGKTPEAARGMAVFATLIMVMLGGAWAPSFIFPDWMQSLTIVIPTRWAVDGLDAMTWRGLGMDAALRCAGVQLAFTALFGVLALWKFRAERA